MRGGDPCERGVPPLTGRGLLPGAILAIGLAAAGLLAGCGSDGAGCPEEFARERWQMPRAEDRAELAQQVEDCGVIDDARRAEVLTMLGEPSQPRGKSRQKARLWLYYIGDSEETYGPGESRFLVVEFDARGRVVTAEVDPDRVLPGE